MRTDIFHFTNELLLARQPEVYLGVVVREDPREDRVLHEVVVGSARQGVQVHQILEVADFTSLRKDSKDPS